MIDKVNNKMVSQNKKPNPLPRWVTLKRRVDTPDRVFYPGDVVDLFKYPKVRKVLDGVRHSQRTYITK